MATEKHCATCRCASTITGQIAVLLDADPSRVWTPADIAEAINYEGNYLFATLNRMAREEKIEMLSRGRYRSLVKLAELREIFAGRS